MEDEAILKAILKAMDACGENDDWRSVLSLVPAVLFILAEKHADVLSNDEITILLADIPGAIMRAMEVMGEAELAKSIESTTRALICSNTSSR